ncbi:HAD family hydrolase [Paludibacterium paludis]|uniref:Haloacid dehalogenase n=1 Tax=Paludibacterium paludis TaxID=1225769 RepID=A0A918P4H6_9NEIS|nr:HAD family phosphatase [Paludibacterium paludis]GGY19260.1 haloacid dehalogenase [Paludibacterium paludis]
MHHPLDAVIFDMDGLMIDSEAVSRDAWRDSAAQLAIPVSDELIHAMTGLAVKRCARLLETRYAPEDARRLLERWRARYRERLDSEGIPLKPGIEAVLEWAHRFALPCAVASSTERALLDLKLGRTGLIRHFDATVAGDEVARTKPAPDLYLAAASRLGIAPERCVALEDSPIGMEAALAAGIRVIQVPDLLTASSELADRAVAVCATLNDALPVLQTLRDAAILPME